MSHAGDPVAGAWDSYWNRAGTGPAYCDDGADHPELAAFWESEITSFAERHSGRLLLDVATGNGAVVERALAAMGDDDPLVTCLDNSIVAIKATRARFPGVSGVVASAAAMPFDREAFDLVTSQFGAEYAGPAAINEAAALVAPGGTLAMLVHHRGGSIYRTCSEDGRAVLSLRESRFLPLARKFFEKGFAAVRGADRAAYEKAGKMFAPAVASAEEIVSTFGADVAGGMIARLYKDVGRMHERIQYLEPGEVVAWIDAMDAEVSAYAQRLAAMMQAAIDEPAFARIRVALERAGFDVRRAEAFCPAGEPMPAAWAIVAFRSA